MSMTRERAYEIVKELLRIEEVTDSANLTSAERRELQQIVQDAMTGITVTGENAEHLSIEGSNSVMRMHVPTPEGELRAYIDNDPQYPAIMVLLNPSGTNDEIDLVNAEFSEEDGRIQVKVWGNAMTEEYTHLETLINLDDCRQQFIDAETESNE